MDIWQQERTLARTTLGWGGLSLVGGLTVAARGDAWWRGFGLQTAGWGVVDAGIAVVASRLQDRRMRRLPDPFATQTLEREQRTLFRILAVNAAADVGYVVLGVVLARSPRARVAGSGAAIVVQGGFLLLHDTWHAWEARARD